MQRRTILGMAAACGIAGQSLPVSARAQAPAPPFPATPAVVGELTESRTPVNGSQRRCIDLVICLDTSGSMSGLIESAKQKLWAIVSDLALAEPTPDLRVALLSYGNNGYNPEEGWVRVDSDLTSDLDLISQLLFSFRTNGGTEYVGRVLQAAVRQLDWVPSNDALKLIIVAGNESADQDQEAPFRDVCRDAIAGGIMVNSIYCGPPTDAIAAGWREIAQRADGHFASIDHNNGTVVVGTPFDSRLAELSTSLNTTYVPYGAYGREGRANQVAQDANAQSLNPEAAAARAATKGGKMYRNAFWDLVDASRDVGFDLADIRDEDLPENMQAMTLEARQAYINDMIAQRQAIQEEIRTVAQQRQDYITQELKNRGLDESESFDAAVRRAVREQAASKGFVFPTGEGEVGRAETGQTAAGAESAAHGGSDSES